MTDILSLTQHNIKKGDSLHLANSHFAYPPFHSYNLWCVAPSVKKSEKNVTGYTPGEGGSGYYSETYTFTETGEFEVVVIQFKYGTGDTVAEKIHHIKVIVE